MAGLRGLIAFYWDRVDGWYEEDEEVFVHPNDPHVRIDIRACRRRVIVRMGEEVIADSRDVLRLFETGLATRHYFPRADVKAEVLVASETRTRCPYKGEAYYHSVHAGDRVLEDLVWFYPEPLAEVGRIRDRLCFYAERADSLTIETAP